jgi:hypothetical protein
VDDEKVIELNRPKQSIIDLIDASPGGEKRRADGKRRSDEETLPSLEKLSPLPRPGDAYVAYSRAANKPVPTLHCVLADGTVRGLSYALLETVDLLLDGPGKGMVIVAVFGGTSGTQEVRIAGRNLDTLYSYMGHRRVWWVRQIPPSRDFTAGGEEVVTRIEIRRKDDSA